MIRHQDYFDDLHPPALVVARDSVDCRDDAGDIRRLLLPSRCLDGRRLLLRELPVRRFHRYFARLVGWQTSPRSPPRNLSAASARACRGLANCPLSPAADPSGLRAPAVLSAAGSSFSRAAAAITGNAVARDASAPPGRADAGSASRSGGIGRGPFFLATPQSLTHLPIPRLGPQSQSIFVKVERVCGRPRSTSSVQSMRADDPSGFLTLAFGPIHCPSSGSRSQGAAAAHALTSPSCPIIAPAPHPAAGFPASP
jgi:hypothetical protein